LSEVYIKQELVVDENIGLKKVRKMSDLVQFLRKYALIFLSVLSVFSVVKILAGSAV
jgi:hypothetical protein